MTDPYDDEWSFEARMAREEARRLAIWEVVAIRPPLRELVPPDPRPARPLAAAPDQRRGMNL